MDPIRFNSAANYTDQLDRAFNCCMNLQTKEIIKGKLIDENLNVTDKPTGFWHKAKVTIICLLTLGLYDQYPHFRANKIAMTIFDSVTTYGKHLKDEILNKSIQLLEALNSKTKQKYKNDMMSVIDKINAIIMHNAERRKEQENNKQKTFQERMTERTEDKGIQVMVETLDETEWKKKIDLAQKELKNNKPKEENFITGTVNYIKSWQPW